MLRNRLSILRVTLLACAAILLPACDTDGPGKPGYNLAGPVTTQAVVTVTSNKGTLPVLTDNFATLTVTVVNSATGAPAPDLTVVAMSTNIGSFGSLGGPAELLLETVGGRASTVFFPGEILGTATIRAEALGGVGFVSIRIR
jgi:hypothetical protein